MSDRLIYIDGVGEILFKHSSRARHLGISVRPFLGARVSIPIGMSYNSAVRLVAEKKGWIIQHLKKMREFEKQQTIFNEYSGYCTKHYKLELRKSDRKNISVRLSKGKINVTYPAELNTNTKEIQSAIRTGIERALKIEAKQYLPDKVKVLSAKFGFEYNKLTLKNIKSRWGSCSRNNNINLSIHLMRLPEHLIDYVILHELVHTVHHNHSARFWSKLDEIKNGAKNLDKELKKYRIAIY
ncbi:MAG: M48 family metallopeptidase [Ignavibacteriales bacterium]|nr:M48 family metallopeptidase [Ignavibacteriales bacterium]